MPANQIRNIVAGGERTSRSLLLQAAGGVLDNVALNHRHGLNEDMDDIGMWHNVWPQTHNYPRVLSPGILNIVSSSPDDAITSNGAQRILIIGSDVDGNRIMSIVDLNGTTPVQTLKSYFWFEFAHVIQAGEPYGGAFGTISISLTGGLGVGDNPLVGTITPEFNRTLNALMVIPNEFSGYILGTTFGTGATNRGAMFALRITAANGVRQVMSPTLISGGGPHVFNSPAPERIHYPSLVELVVKTVVPNTQTSGGMTMLLINDEYDFSIPEELLLQPAVEILKFLKDNSQIETNLFGL